MIKKITITGIVQGVGMRYFIATLARKHHLLGEVQNNTDGSVTCIIKGDKTQIHPFIKALKDDSPGDIAQLDITTLTTHKPYSDFTITH